MTLIPLYKDSNLHAYRHIEIYVYLIKSNIKLGTLKNNYNGTLIAQGMFVIFRKIMVYILEKITWDYT